MKLIKKRKYFTEPQQAVHSFKSKFNELEEKNENYKKKMEF